MKNQIRTFPVLFLAILLGLGSCTSESPKTTDTPNPTTTEASKNSPAKTTPLSFSDKSFEKKGGPCPSESESCIEIKIKYPLAKGGTTSIRDSINKYINTSVTEVINFDPDRKIQTPEVASDSLIADYLYSLQEEPGMTFPWSVEIDGKAEEIGSVIVVTLGNYTYMGGAHPNSFVTIKNFDRKTGKSITYSDIVLDTTAFKALVKQEFIKTRNEIEGVENVLMEDYFWGSGFQLPTNFGFLTNGLYFYYNPYEAAAYALGNTEFEIPFEKLKGIIKQ